MFYTLLKLVVLIIIKFEKRYLLSQNYKLIKYKFYNKYTLSKQNFWQ